MQEISISEKVFSRAQTRTRSIIEFANTVYCTHTIFIGTIRIHVFCKHPRKLEVKSDGDISDGAFYRTSFAALRSAIRRSGPVDASIVFQYIGMLERSLFPQFIEARVERGDDVSARKMQSLRRERVESRKHLAEKYARFARQMQVRRYGKLRKEYHTREDAAFV